MIYCLSIQKRLGRDNLIYSRAEFGAVTRRNELPAVVHTMELWFITANSLERSRCVKIGAPLVEKAKRVSLSHSPYGIQM